MTVLLCGLHLDAETGVKVLVLCFAGLSISTSTGAEQDTFSAVTWPLHHMQERRVERPNVPTTVIAFDVTEGTFMSVDVSPDGETLVFDLLGDIYAVPIAGGQATSLTAGRAWDKAPRYSTDGKSVYFVSDRRGFKNIWQLDLSGGSPTVVTNSKSDILGTPNWAGSGDGLLAGLGDADRMNAEVILHSINTKNGVMKPIDPPSGPAFDWSELKTLRPYVRIYSAVQAADGQLYYSQAYFDEKLGRRVVRLHMIEPELRTREILTPRDASYSEYKPQLSRDEEALAYFRQYSDRRTELRLLNRETGRDVALLELSNADDAAYGASQELLPNYSFTPDDRHIIFWHEGKIYRLNILDRSSEIIPFRVAVRRDVWKRAQPAKQPIEESDKAKIVRWPSVSGDGKRMAFAAIGFVWVMDLETRQIRRLTTSDDFEYMPAISPDGYLVAYVSFAKSADGFGSGRLMIANVEGGKAYELLAGANTSYLLPNWSDDGTKIAAIQEVSAPGGTEAAFGWTAVASGRFYAVAPAPASDKYLSGHIYSRFVAFDNTGQSLLFSYPESKGKIVLASAGLDGGSVRLVAAGRSDVAGITPAPDLENLALTRRDGSVWLLDFNPTRRSRFVSTSSVGVRRISDASGYYLQWNDSSLVTYGFGSRVYRYQLREDRLGSVVIEVRFPVHRSEQPVAFIGGRLITMVNSSNAKSVIDPGTIIVRGSSIAAVGSVSEVTMPSNASIIDVSGKTILPGLVDSHYHRIGGSGGAIGLSALKLPNPSFGDKSAIGYGITTAWEPGGPWDDGSPATADLQKAGRILGPQWSQSAMGTVGYPWEQLSGYAQALAAVEMHKALGVVVLKEYNTPTRTQQQWLSAAARASGLGIVSHLESLEGMMTRVIDGYTGGDHASIPIPYFDDVAELLRRTGYIWTPNISISDGSIGVSSDSRAYYWREVQQKYPEQLEKLKAMTSSDRIDETNVSQPSVPYEAHRVSRVAEQAAAASADGVHVGVSGHNMPGVNLHRELWYLWRGGLPAEAVLRAATIGNAEKLGLNEQIGTLEAGKIANILILDANPLQDMLNTLSIRYTIQQGIIYDSTTAQILQPPTMNEFRPSLAAEASVP